MKKFLTLMLMVCLTSVSAQFLPSATLVNTSDGIVSDHIRVIFLAEGYQSGEEWRFNNKVNDAIAALQSTEPYSNNITKFGYYKYWTPSTDSGISRAAGNGTTAIVKDTYWNFHWNHNGVLRSIGIDDPDRLALDNELSQYQQPNGRVHAIAIINSSEYGGSGEVDGRGDLDWLPVLQTEKAVSLATASSCHIFAGYSPTYDLGHPDSEENAFDFLIRHEFGHSFGDLDDEYLDAAVAATHDYSTPNKSNVRHSEDSGLFTYDKFEFEGARYTINKWRREQNKIMKGASTVTGTAPLKIISFPTTHAHFTKNDIQNKIDEYFVNSQAGVKVFLSEGFLSSSAACGDAREYTYYHDGDSAYPDAGDKVYIDEAMTTWFNGGLKYYYSPGGEWIRINSSGLIIKQGNCSSSPPQ